MNREFKIDHKNFSKTFTCVAFLSFGGKHKTYGGSVRNHHDSKQAFIGFLFSDEIQKKFRKWGFGHRMKSKAFQKVLEKFLSFISNFLLIWRL